MAHDSASPDSAIPQPKPQCFMNGCERPADRRGACTMHYMRWYEHGSFYYEPPTFEDRFWAKVEKTSGCWNWTGTKLAQGYGMISHNRKMRPAHRISWEMVNGKIPDGLDIMHMCDNPSCVNPDHLKPGTHQDNMLDMFRKGRRKTRFDAEMIRDIRRRCAEGETTISVARSYRVAGHTIVKIVRREAWAHVE